MDKTKTLYISIEDELAAEYVKEHGGIDLVVERKYLNSTIGTLLRVLLKKSEIESKTDTTNVVKLNKNLQSAS